MSSNKSSVDIIQAMFLEDPSRVQSDFAPALSHLDHRVPQSVVLTAGYVKLSHLATPSLIASFTCQDPSGGQMSVSVLKLRFVIVPKKPGDPESFVVEYLMRERRVTGLERWIRLAQRAVSPVYFAVDGSSESAESKKVLKLKPSPLAKIAAFRSSNGVWPTAHGVPLEPLALLRTPKSDGVLVLFWEPSSSVIEYKAVSEMLKAQTAEEHYREEAERG